MALNTFMVTITDDVEQRLLAGDNFKSNGRKGAESNETEDEVNDVVDDLRVNADLPHAQLEVSGVAYDAQQIDALQKYCGGTKE
ncbi:hypothetical protein DAPPUDRAFT_249018 [Daphnia pulex]|uniref:Uncharacterized protein n=1 Tax=Daphnia pulex TaxID=6669 RepID=E9GVP2_DAPPU|nr:hypothetical protein DAPPUDRAFT_249018 [Daphnia pulex]|eukprot:EFX76493.1 hypothetical protein DAPPUDRAFT_249018 [Daphnia pulex]